LQFHYDEQEISVLELSEKWAPVLATQPETGMGFQIVSVFLNDGRHFDRVTVVGGIITQVNGESEIPFTENEISDIRVTHGH